MRTAVTREWDSFRQLLPAVDGQHWAEPTRLGEWTVHDLAAHAVWGISMEADALRRRGTTTGERARGSGPDPASGPDVVRAQLDAARDELVGELAGLTEGDLDVLAPLPYGDCRSPCSRRSWSWRPASTPRPGGRRRSRRGAPG